MLCIDQKTAWSMQFKEAFKSVWKIKLKHRVYFSWTFVSPCVLLISVVELVTSWSTVSKPGLVLWLCELNHHLWCSHPKWAPIQIPAALFPMQLPTYTSEKAAKNDPSLWAPAPMWQMWKGFRLLALTGPNPAIAYIWGVNQWMEERALSLTPLLCTLSLSLCKHAFQIYENKSFLFLNK